MALCQAESEEIETPSLQAADFTYLRLRKDAYPKSARKKIATKVKGLAKVGDVFAFLKHEESPECALHAEELFDATSGS